MDLEQGRKWIGTVSLVVIAVCSVINMFRIEFMRINSNKIMHAVTCDLEHGEFGGPRENWNPLCRLADGR